MSLSPLLKANRQTAIGVTTTTQTKGKETFFVLAGIWQPSLYPKKPVGWIFLLGYGYSIWSIGILPPLLLQHLGLRDSVKVATSVELLTMSQGRDRLAHDVCMYGWLSGGPLIPLHFSHPSQQMLPVQHTQYTIRHLLMSSYWLDSHTQKAHRKNLVWLSQTEELLNTKKTKHVL